jgi:hypothetical protein
MTGVSDPDHSTRNQQCVNRGEGEVSGVPGSGEPIAARPNSSRTAPTKRRMEDNDHDEHSLAVTEVGTRMRAS